MRRLDAIRHAATVALLAIALALALALEDPTPSIVPLAAAVALAPWRAWKTRRARPLGRADLMASVVFLGALILTLLIPDGAVRWLVIAALTLAWVSSWWLLDPDR